MRVPSGRLKAVFVASVATTILIGAMAPATALATDPPGLARFMAAVAKVESSGDYYARNASGAYGRYQIMPSSWRAWAGRYLLDANARPTPANQDFVAASKFRALYSGLASWRRVAYWWLTGSSRTSGWSYRATRYVNRVMGYYLAPPAGLLMSAAAAVAVVPVRRFSERSPRITYTGTWKIATRTAYAGGAARYATSPGASASFSFTGTKVVWYGPVGPTRGHAKVFLDGVYQRTIDLRATTFRARKLIFGRSWATAGAHTLVIEVAGTPGHRVAIDEFAIAVGTVAPSAAPNAPPSEAPSEAPSTAPSEAPSAPPSEAPSTAPSEAPSAAPSEAPSEAPSAAPDPAA